MTAMPRFDCDDIDGLIGLFALDALTADEAAGVREHLATCDRPHGDASCMAAATGALAVSVEPVDAPVELRARLMSAVAVTAQVPDDIQVVATRGALTRGALAVAPVAVAPVAVAPVRVVPAEPIPIDAVRARRGPSRMAWFGLAAAAVIVIAALGAWNVSLQRQVSDAQAQVAGLQQAVTTATGQLTAAQQQATKANAQLASLQGTIADTQAQLTAAVQRANTSDAQVASLQGKLEDMNVQLASYQQQVASADERVALIGQAIGAATAPGSNVATLASASPAGGSAAGMAIFPASGTGYLMIEGLPEIATDQTYEAWFGVGGEMSSAGLVTPGPHGLAIVGNVDPIPGTDTIAVTIEAAGGADHPTGTPIIIGTLPIPVALGGTSFIQ